MKKNIIDKKLGIDENKLSEEISKNLSLRQFETADRYADRTERDVYSIIYTYERRKKIISKDFIDAKYSFITENALLTKADRNIIYEYTDKKIKRTDLFTAAIPEAMLCSYLYLGSSKKAVNNITMSVLATAYTAIRPTPELEALVKDIALKLKDDGRITEKEYHLVTSSYLIKDCLSAHILFILKLIGLCIPYIMSGISFFKISWMSSLVIFIIWTVFCFLINHFYPINLKIMWENTYIKALTRAYEHFELDLGKDQI